MGAENLKADVHNSPCSEKTETIHTAGETTTMDEEQMDENDCDGAYEDSAPEMDVEESSDDEVDDDGATTSNYQTTTPCSPERHSETKQTENTRLPSWQPRTQIYQEHSHVVVAAFVPGMNMDKLNIMVDGTDLLVKGTKRPTVQDLISYQHGRAQHFGHLNLKIALPTDVVHTEGATATYEDGVESQVYQEKHSAVSPTGKDTCLPSTDARSATYEAEELFRSPARILVKKVAD